MSTNAWSEIRAQLAQATPANRFAIQNRAARAIGDLITDQKLPANVTPLRMALLRSMTAELLVPPIVSRLAGYDFATQVTLGQLGNIAHETLTPDSFVYRDGFDVVVVLALAEHVLSDGDAAASDQFLTQMRSLAERFSGQVIIANFVPSLDQVAPVLNVHSLDSIRARIIAHNARLVELAAEWPHITIWDADRVQRRLGEEHFWSRRDNATSMQPFSVTALDSLAMGLADVCLLARRAPVKCLVLDCDNTLWGGVVGEDGLAGIKLGETYPGVCYQQFQRQLVELSQLGFLIALNSKNNAADVWNVFENHAGMLLKREHIAAYRINWQDKASNLRELAEELNLGLDSFVFIDDSDYEINLVYSELPQVRTLQAPTQVWNLPRLLPEARVIDRLRVTAEDRNKTEMYRAEAERRSLKAASTDLQAYLESLSIALTYEPFKAETHLARTAQLTQKTNQFNLTTRRYDEAAILKQVDDGAIIALAQLRDRFGDYGRVVLAIVTPPDPAGVAELDTFLMSCRVIGRGVEKSFLWLVMKTLAGRGVKQLKASFIPSERNAVCANFLTEAGFSVVDRDENGSTCYICDLTRAIPEPEPWLTIKE